MSKYLIAAFAFVAVAAVGTTSHAQFRDAGSKARGGDMKERATRSARIELITPRRSTHTRLPRRPGRRRSSGNSGSAVGQRHGRRQQRAERNAPCPVEPQAVAPTMTYRVGPRRSYSRTPWMYRADHKVLGHFNP